jgi:DsbC/DsbD-like thiol-disulfide interchange protein
VHFPVSTGVGFLVALGAAGQLLAPKPSAVQHVSVETSVSAPGVVPGATLTLWADVTPNSGVHVYAPGAKAFDFTPVSIVLTPHASVSAGKPRFPSAQPAPPGSIDEKVPIFAKAFRIAQPITLRQTAKPGEVVTISGAVNYQACDDRICYPPSSVSLHWTVTVR